MEIVYTDGATVGHNGKLGTVSEVGIGVYFANRNKRMYARMPGISNNEAEYKALITAMQLCIKYGIKDVEFRCDSQNIVNGANTKTRKDKQKDTPKAHASNRMNAFKRQIHELRKQLRFVSFVWIPRELNGIADELSKKASMPCKQDVCRRTSF